MTVNQSSIPVAVDEAEAQRRSGWLSSAETSEVSSGEPDDRLEAVTDALMPPPARPTWPRVYPGL